MRVSSTLEVLHIESGIREPLHHFDDIIEAPNWTGDGKHLIYNSNGRLYAFELATRRSTLIHTGLANQCNNDHVLSPDQKHIAISHHAVEDGQSRIYTLPLAGGKPKLVTPLGPSYLHGWSPDGERLAYCAERDGQYDIYTIPVRGGEELRLTNTPGLDDGPEYSPDGTYLWFNSVRTGRMQVWRMKTDGSEQMQMTFEDTNNWFPHVSPNGKHVVYLSYLSEDVAPADHPANKDVELRMMPSDGGESHTLVRLFGGQGTINVNSWSPDSKSVAFVHYAVEQETE